MADQATAVIDPEQGHGVEPVSKAQHLADFRDEITAQHAAASEKQGAKGKRGAM
ncbi:MAG TPA: hypothetical protein VFQ54_00675 [Thermomicrobiales bacterium]|nr:hypothetical protein [Thermomicrobiales bacterium]